MGCCCEQKYAAVYSGISGIIMGPPNQHAPRVIERCDACGRFPSDEAAAVYYVTVMGGTVRYDEQLRVTWTTSR